MFNWFKRAWQAVTSFLGSFFQAEVNISENITTIINSFTEGRRNIEDGVYRIKHFKFDPQWRTRVINVPAAADAVVALYEEVFGDFRERMQILVEPIHQLSLIFRAEKENPDPLGGPSALARTSVKIDEIATMISQLAEASKVALNFTQAFDDVIINLETLDVIFLQQGNKRKWVSDESARIRLGNLHS
jgi:hypothetical protein